MTARITLIKLHARQVLQDSIAFRTTVIASIHAEIYQAVWEGQQDESQQRIITWRPPIEYSLSRTTYSALPPQ